MAQVCGRVVVALLFAAAVSAMNLKSPVKLFDVGKKTCDCLHWKEAYTSGKVECGKGLENSHGKSNASAVLADHAPCFYTPYPDLQDNYCMKVLAGSRLPVNSNDLSDQTWCYVSANCKELGLGLNVNKKVSWKTCKAGVDTRYADVAPKEMLGMLDENGWKKDYSLMFAMGYPYAEETWDQVAGFFDKSKEPVSLEQQAKLQALVDAKSPIVFCTSLQAPGGGQPDACGPDFSLHVLGNSQVWWVPHTQEPPTCVWGC